MATIKVPVEIWARFHGSECELGKLTVNVRIDMQTGKDGKVTFGIMPETVFSQIIDQMFQAPAKEPEPTAELADEPMPS